MKTIKKIISVSLLIGIMMIAGCVDKRPLSAENKIYAGKWVTNDGIWIQIYNDGGGSFEKSNSKVTGGAATIADKTIKIGLMGIDATFNIDKAPFEENGEWKIQLDGNIYIKQ